MRRFCTHLALALLFAAAFTQRSTAQETPLEEPDVPLKMQTYFFTNYNHAKNVQWYAVENIGDKLYMVRFQQDNFVKSVVYNSRGTLQQETSESRKGQPDYIMSSKALEKHPEGKIEAVRKVTMFSVENGGSPAYYYEVTVKLKDGVQSVYFDYEKQLMKTDNVFNLAVN